MKHCRTSFYKVAFFFLGVLFIASPLFAQDLSYDRYTETLREPEAPSRVGRSIAHFLVYPFEIIRYGTDKTLVAIEKHHIDKKVKWIYEKIQSYGISPHLNFVSMSNRSYGADIDFIRLVQKKEYLPDSTLSGWVRWAEDGYFRAGGKVGWSLIKGTGLRTFGIANYENRHEEHFYGVGPHSSAGDGAVFSWEETKLEYQLGYSKTPEWGIDGKFSYRNVNISGGRDGGRGQIGEIPTFSEERIPGFHGDSFLTWKLEVIHDTRNQKENSTIGGMQRFGFSFNEGLNSSLARFFRYETEVSHYFRLGADRRVLAFHFYGEHNDEVNNGQVPFHQMAKLGGYGTSPHMSHTLRGYDFNRFFDESALLFNIEYRYTIWEYRDYKLDTVFFWDEGQVFGEFSEFQLSDFRESYGIGFRLSVANVMFLALEVAHGDEGTNLYVKGSSPF
ncbi:MAG: BamA/TamA family outer membrane protein [Candidatus Omnitrophica bacterium]|nr:BamA/TamA family outer membrane protein [Candidatus Omnitrophota bacterium]